MKNRNLIGETLYKLLIITCNIENNRFQWVWRKVSKYLNSNYDNTAKIKIHGKVAFVNIGFTYPITSKRFKNYNNPLVELVYQVAKNVKRKIILLDIGAAIGDTAFLLDEKCPDLIEKIVCIDGDPKFFEYLSLNLKSIPYSQPIFTTLSGDGGKIKELVRIHTGTASAQGKGETATKTLDNLCREYDLDKIDIIKVDVDGFDGQVIKGTSHILTKNQPLVIFEWHPKLCIQTNNNFTDAFETFKNHGYDQFLWYNKYGYFSFLTDNSFDISSMAQLCINSNHDWHYDIIAIHPNSKVNKIDLIDLSYSMLKRK